MSEIRESGVSYVEDILSISPLLLQVEKQIISILLVHGLVKINNITNTMEDNRFNNISLTNLGQAMLDEDPILGETIEAVTKKIGNVSTIKSTLTDEQVESYRDIFPTGCKGPGKKMVRFKLEKFMLDYKCTYDEIVSAAKLYIRNNSSKGYNIAAAHYFLYKQDQQSKLNESKAEEYLEEVRRLNINNTPDWRDQIV